MHLNLPTFVPLYLPMQCARIFLTVRRSFVLTPLITSVLDVALTTVLVSESLPLLTSSLSVNVSQKLIRVTFFCIFNS
jgi:hypothetical protein